MSKAKQMAISKSSEVVTAEEPGGRIFLELSSVTARGAGEKDFELNQKNWKSLVVEDTGKK